MNFHGNSLVGSVGFYTDIKYAGVTEKRKVIPGQHVDVYRNLNKANCFSIKPREGENKGKVSGYAPCVIVRDVKFVHSLSGQRRVVEKGQKNVHAYLRGTFLDAFDETSFLTDKEDVIRVCYNPFISSSFFMCKRDQSGEIIKHSIEFIDSPPASHPIAVVSHKDVVLLRDLE